MACALTKDTSPRLLRMISHGDSGDQNMACALTSQRRLRDLLETEKVSPKNRTCLNFPRLPGDPASLQETSRRRLRDLPRLGRPKNGLRSHQGYVAATTENDQSRRLGRPKHGLRSHVAETSPRPAGD